MKMKALDLEKLPEKIQSGELSRKQAIHALAEFVLSNRALYGLARFDEDFANEIVLNLLENGECIFDKYNRNSGSFFNFFYNRVKNIAYTKYRCETRKNINENFNTSESISSYSDVMESYDKMNYGFLEDFHVPYAAPKISRKDLKAAFKIPCIKQVHNDKHRFILNSLNTEQKAFLVVSLKSAFYLNDESMNLVSKVCSVDGDDLCTVVQEIIGDLNLRINRKHKMEERRNRFYYYFCKYDTLSNKLGLSDEKKHEYTSKAKNYKQKLDEINGQLHKGFINIRPSNRVLADAVSSTERQILYYLKIANTSCEFKKIIEKEINRVVYGCEKKAE